MKKVKLLIGFLVFCFAILSTETFAQNFLPTPMEATNPNQNDTGVNKSKSDTLWLYRNLRTSHWEDKGFKPLETYTYYEYSSPIAPTKPNKIFTINTFTDDTVMYRTNAFDSLQRITKQTFYIFDSLSNSLKFTDQYLFWYDEFDNDTMVVWQRWADGLSVWTNYKRYQREYNSKNHLILDKIQQWDPQVNYWATVFGYNYQYFYNSAGCPDSLIWNEWDAYEKGWINYIRQYWAYDENNTPLEYWYELWDASFGKYQNYQRFFNLNYSNWPGCGSLDHTYKPIFYSFNQQNWLNEWIDIVEFNASYDDLGGYESIIRRYIDYEWKNSEKREVRFHSNGYYILFKVEKWVSDSWEIDRADTTTLLFENDKLIESILYQADTSNNNIWVPFTKFQYSDYIWYLGVDDYYGADNIRINKVSIVPNPSKGNFSVELIDNTESISSVQLINISGKTIFQQQFVKSKLNTVEIKNQQFEKGVYIVRTTTKSKIVYHSKLIVH